jgi:hypothetical protein
MFKPHHLNPWHRAATFWVPPFWHVLKMIDKWHLLMAKRYGRFDKHVMTKRVEEVKAKSVDLSRILQAPKLTTEANQDSGRETASMASTGGMGASLCFLGQTCPRRAIPANQ